MIPTTDMYWTCCTELTIFTEHAPCISPLIQKPSDVKWENYWNPKLYIDNTVGDPKETIWKTVVFNSNQEAFIYERRRIKGVFLENMELNQFPFDTQVTAGCLSLKLIKVKSRQWLK